MLDFITYSVFDHIDRQGAVQFDPMPVIGLSLIKMHLK